MDKVAIVISAVTAFIIATAGSLGVVFVGGPPTAWQIAASIALGLGVAAKDTRSLLKLPPLDGGDPPATPPVSRLPILFLIGVSVLALSGCGTLYTNIVTMKKVGDSISVEYAQLYKAGLISPEQDAKAEAAHAEYRQAMGVLAAALEAAQLSGDASDVPGKLRAAKQAITPMLNLISPLLSNSKANTLQKQLTTASAQ